MRKVVDESAKVPEAECRCSEPQLIPAGGMRSEEGTDVERGGMGLGLHHPGSTIGLRLGSEVASCSRSAFRYSDSSKGPVLELAIGSGRPPAEADCWLEPGCRGGESLLEELPSLRLDQGTDAGAVG